MTEEMKRHGRLATALIAGPAVTVGMLGAGAAPVMAQDEGEPDAQDVVEEEGVSAGEDNDAEAEDESGAEDAEGDESDADSDSDGDSEGDDSEEVADVEDADDEGEEDVDPADVDEPDTEPEELQTFQETDVESEFSAGDTVVALQDVEAAPSDPVEATFVQGETYTVLQVIDADTIQLAVHEGARQVPAEFFELASEDNGGPGDDAGEDGPENEDAPEGGDQAEGPDAPTITIGPRDISGSEENFIEVTAENAPVYADIEGEELLGYVSGGGYVGSFADADSEFADFVASSDALFEEHFGATQVYFAAGDVTNVDTTEAPDEDQGDTSVPDYDDLPVFEFPPRDASDVQDEVVLVITERAPVYAYEDGERVPVAYIAAGSIVVSNNADRVDEVGQFINLTDELFERELNLRSVQIRTDHVTAVDDDSAVSDGPRPEAPDSDAPTVELADPEYDGDLWNLAVVTDRAPVYGSYTEGLNDDILAYVPAGTLIRFANWEDPSQVEDGRNPDLVGVRIMVESPELADALDTTDFFLFYIPTDFLRNANDDDVEIYYDDDENGNGEEPSDPSDPEDPVDDDEDADTDGDGATAEEGSVELTVDSDEVLAGDQLTVVGEGFEAGEDVDFVLNPELGTFPADDEGVVTAEVTIPEDTEPGEYTITATGQSSELSGSVGITVVEPTEVDPAGEVEDQDAPADTGAAPAAADQGEELAATGMTGRDVGLLSGLLLLVGGGLAALGYKNRLGRRDADA